MGTDKLGNISLFVTEDQGIQVSVEDVLDVIRREGGDTKPVEEWIERQFPIDKFPVERPIDWESLPEKIRDALMKIVLDNAKGEQKIGRMLYPTPCGCFEV